MNAHCNLPLLLVGVALFCHGNHAQAQPTSVWTSSQATAILSGPGEQFYPVLKLPAGTQLEVHQELPGGWLAIRPPQGCFSLLSATAVETVDYRTGRITRDGAASRVGSALVGDYDAVHVRLQRGELVEVLDPSPDPESHLVRIAPPAGEFRWVHESNVSRQPLATAAAVTESVEVVANPSADTGAAPAIPPVAGEQLAIVAVTTEQVASGDSPSAEGEWRIREGTADPADSAIRGVEPVRYDSPANPTTPIKQESDQLADKQPANTTASTKGVEESPPTAATSSAAPAPATTNPSQLNQSFAAQLDQLEIQISRRVAGPPNLWVFDDLEREAARLASLATTKDEMATIRELGIRMSRFTNIASRHRALPPQQLAVSGSARAGAARSDEVGPIREAPGYDAVGILRPVVSKRPGAPPYALVDERGEVITFVTPGPSVNMQAYLGQRVAVSGARAYLPEYRRRNIQTARVMSMEGTRTR
jgi:hypothetical protein